MKKLLLALWFLVAPAAFAQYAWDPIQNSWTRLDGGDPSSNGTVTSVGISGPAEFVVNCGTNPVTTFGTLCFAWASGSAPSSNDLMLISVGGTYVSKAVNDCQGAGKALTYTVSTHTVGCNTIGGGLADPGGNGYVVRTSLNTTINRTFTVTAPMVITNADGTGGNTNFSTPVFVASGGSHAAGLVPDPGATAGTDNFLREDGFTNPFIALKNKLFIYSDLCENWGNVVKTGNTGTGAGSSTLAGPPGAHPCVQKFSSGTTASPNWAGFEVTASTDTGNITLGTNAVTYLASVQVPALSDGTNTFLWDIGFCDRMTAACSDGIFFEYDQATDTHWRIVTSKAGTTTKATTTNTVTAGQWDSLKIVVNAAATSVAFYLCPNDVCTEVSGSPLTTNIPTNSICIGGHIEKTAGTTNRDIYLDYYMVYSPLAAR